MLKVIGRSREDRKMRGKKGRFSYVLIKLNQKTKSYSCISDYTVPSKQGLPGF